MNVVFKDGVQLPLEVWQHDHTRRIIAAAMAEAPELVDDTLVVTSVWREPTGGVSYHFSEGRAVDFRTGLSGSTLDAMAYQPRAGAIAVPSALGAYQTAQRRVRTRAPIPTTTTARRRS